jgi:hypothetical protein
MDRLWIPRRALRVRRKGERGVGQQEQDGSARYWKASSKEETAGKKLRGEIVGGNMEDF